MDECLVDPYKTERSQCQPNYDDYRSGNPAYGFFILDDLLRPVLGTELKLDREPTS